MTDRSTSAPDTQNTGLPDIDWLPAPMLLLDGTGNCLAASQGAADLLGTRRKDLLNDGWLHHFENATANIRWIASMARIEGGAPALELHTGPTRRRFRLAFKPVPGVPHTLSVTLAETTAERAAIESSAHHKTLLDRVQNISSTGYWRYEVATGQVVWSDRVFEIHGMEPDPAGVTIDQAVAAYHPDDRQRVRDCISHSIETGAPFDFDLRIVRADGSLRHVIARGEVDGAHDIGSCRLFGVFQDVTDERDRAQASRITQERLSLVVKASRDGVWDWRYGSDEVFYSDRFKEILGLSEPGNLMSVERAKSLIHPDDLETYSALVVAHLEGHKRCDAEIRLMQPDGCFIWTEIKAVAAFDDNGNATRIVGTVGDISARKEAESRMRKARADALAASDAKSKFIATASHELRTPLNGVLGMLDLLANAQLDADQQPLVETAAESARSLLAILDDLLDLSKLDADRLELNPVAFDPVRHVQSVVDLFAPSAAKRNVDLFFDAADNLPETLVADQARLRQVLTNLVGNAVKFTSAGSIRVSAEVIEAEGIAAPSKPRLRYCIADTGIGIAPEMQQKLFQPYAQGSNRTAETYGGTGLGLAICKQLVERMGGTIGVESAPGQGSRFWFTLDAVSPDAITDADEMPTKTADSICEETNRSLHVLIAEDNAVNQRVITAMVSRLGCTFEVVTDGIEAVEAVRRGNFDAVLMDIQMPRMDGVMATRLIREEEQGSGRTLPIIAITAHAMRGTRDDYLKAGMTDFVPKPIEVKTLALALHAVAKKHAPEEAQTAASDLSPVSTAQSA